MLENFYFFIVALAPTLRSAQNLLKKIVSASQLGTSEIRAGMCPATLIERGPDDGALASRSWTPTPLEYFKKIYISMPWNFIVESSIWKEKKTFW
jgi:hypothetical protein